jgi:hypothetical protein
VVFTSGSGRTCIPRHSGSQTHRRTWWGSLWDQEGRREGGQGQQEQAQQGAFRHKTTREGWPITKISQDTRDMALLCHIQAHAKVHVQVLGLAGHLCHSQLGVKQMP